MYGARSFMSPVMKRGMPEADSWLCSATSTRVASARHLAWLRYCAVSAGLWKFVKYDISPVAFSRSSTIGIGRGVPLK